MNLTLDEIKDWAEFENLVASFFRLQYANYSCEIIHSGKGADGGKDILKRYFPKYYQSVK